LVVFVALAVSSAAVYANTAPIEITGDARYNAVQLTPEVYNAANPSLSDLHIVNSKGEAVPYFVYSSNRETAPSDEAYAMVQLDSYLKFEDFYFDFKLREERASDIIATAISFATDARSFAKTVEVYGSHDNINWEYVQDDKLYSIDGIEKLQINFRQPQKFTHYRLKLANNLERITFYDVRLVYAAETVADSYFIAEYSPTYRVSSENRQTRIEIEGVKNMRLLDVEISTTSMFKRMVSSDAGAWKELYSLFFDDASWSDTVLPLNGFQAYREPFALTIEDGDDKPIDVSTVLVRYYADELVFESVPGETYTLVFGEDADTNPPVYDIARYQTEILASGDIAKAALGEIQYAAPVEENDSEVDYSLIFNVVVIGVAVLLGAVLVVLLKRKRHE
jgi:hypothetical protein